MNPPTPSYDLFRAEYRRRYRLSSHYLATRVVGKPLRSVRWWIQFQPTCRGGKHSSRGAKYTDLPMSRAIPMSDEIDKLRKQRPTHPNILSSRAHLAVTFQAVNSGSKYGMLLDIAGNEESSARALLTLEKVRDRKAQRRMCWSSSLIRTAREAVCSSSHPNSRLSSRVLGQRQPPVIKLVYWMDRCRVKMMPENKGRSRRVHECVGSLTTAVSN